MRFDPTGVIFVTIESIIVDNYGIKNNKNKEQTRKEKNKKTKGILYFVP